MYLREFVFIFILTEVNDVVHPAVINFQSPSAPKAMNEEMHHFSSSQIDYEVPVDVVGDLAGRRKLVTKDPKDHCWVYTVITDPMYQLPVVVDPLTGLLYLLQYSDVIFYGGDPPTRLWRLRNTSSGPLVFNRKNNTLLQPFLDTYKQVQLKQVTEEEAGITLADAITLFK